jgi:hypothetical protein
MTEDEAQKKQSQYELKRRRRSIALAINNVSQNAKILQFYCNANLWNNEGDWDRIKSDVDNLATDIMAIELKIITVLGNIYERPGEKE